MATIWQTIKTYVDSRTVNSYTIIADLNNHDLSDYLMTRITNNNAGLAYTISGLVAEAAGTMRIIVNIIEPITISHQSVSSTDVNRIICKSGSDTILGTNGTMTLIYDGTTQRWREL